MPDPPKPKPKFTAEILKERLKTAVAWVKEAAAFAHTLDWLGDAGQHPEESEQRALAKLRDEVDRELAQVLLRVMATTRCRAETSRSVDLLMFATLFKRGDGHDALHLMDRCHDLLGDESEADGEVTDGTLPDAFAWETYLRVSALTDLVEKFPRHLRHSARDMHGWPMIVSHHLDCTPEFQRIAERLEVGADYPLDVSPRKKRGTETPLLSYLEPRVWRLHVLREILIESAETGGQEEFVQRIHCFWWQSPDPEPEAEEIAILRLVPSLPPLTRKTAREWSRRVIVPLILLDDAGTRETCEVPALRNIWAHRSVKSVATFQSRLHSAVTDTLQRFGRPG